MSQVFVITGVQAAGKSTVADALARRFPRGVHVAGDGIRAMVVSGRVDMSPDAAEEAERQLLLRYQAAVAVAALYYEAGFDVVIEDVIIGKMLDEFLAVLPWPAVRLVVLDPSPDEIVRRERGRAKDAYGKAWSVNGLYRILQEETTRAGMWLDTSGLTIEETVDRILADGDGSLVELAVRSHRAD